MAAEKTQANDEGLLVAAAKTIGKAAGTAGKVAHLAGATAPATSTPRKKGKLAPKNKSRLPRRQKKAQRVTL